MLYKRYGVVFYKYNVQKNIEWHFVILLVNNKLINSKIMDFLMVGGIGTSEIMLIVFATYKQLKLVEKSKGNKK